MVRKALLRDIKMVEALTTASKPLVAQRFNLTLRGLDSWLYRIRERRREFRWYENNLLSLEKRNPRIKKALMSVKPSIEVEEEEAEDDKLSFEKDLTKEEE